jgi:nucleotide-binding universal stress UspA family protein
MPAHSAFDDAAAEAHATMNLLRLEVVLAAIDYDDAAPGVLVAARKLAEAAGAKLHVAHADPPRERLGAAADESESAPSHSMLTLLDHAKVDRDSTGLHVIAGAPADVIPDLADRLGADVIVLGPHRELRATEGRMGSTAMAIATASRVPCLIVTHDMHLPLTRVLAPVDLSDTARGALKVALSWSSALRRADAPGKAKASAKTKLTAIHVDSAARGARRNAPTGRALDTEVDLVRREGGTWAGVAMQCETIPSDDVVETIADRAREEHVDLVVLGTRGTGPNRAGRLGSVSDAVMRRVDTPVLLVPPAVWGDAR